MKGELQSAESKALFDSIEKDIAMHNKRAEEILGYVNGVLIAAILLSFLYLAPGIAERALPSQEASLSAATARYDAAFSAFTKKYGKIPYSVEDKVYQSERERGTASPEMLDAWAVSQLRTNDMPVKILRFIKALRPDDEKLNEVAKLFPFLLTGAFTGLLLTYRVHILVARDVTKHKIDTIAKL